MSTDRRPFACAALATALFVVVPAAIAQTPRAQAEDELARKVPTGGVPACSLITRAEVKKTTGRDPLVNPEPAGQGGWICNFGIGELKVYSGPGSWEAWESTLKSFKKDKEPKTPAPEFGERAHFLYPKADNKYQGDVAFLIAQSGSHTLALSLDAPEGASAQSVRPALESLMKSILARLR